jgi:hypothetical protein
MASDGSIDPNKLVFQLQHIPIRTIAKDHLIARVIFLSHHRGETLQFWASESQHWLLSSILDDWREVSRPKQQQIYRIGRSKKGAADRLL